MENSPRLPLIALAVAALLLGAAGLSFAARNGVAVGGGAAQAPPGAGAPAANAAHGGQLFSQLGCQGCHSVTGQAGVGPPLNGIFNSEVRLAGGQTVVADDAYLRESILQPDAKTVEGYPPGAMAAGIAGVLGELQQGNTTADLIAYLETLK